MTLKVQSMDAGSIQLPTGHVPHRNVETSGGEMPCQFPTLFSLLNFHTHLKLFSNTTRVLTIFLGGLYAEQLESHRRVKVKNVKGSVMSSQILVTPFHPGTPEVEKPGQGKTPHSQTVNFHSRTNDVTKPTIRISNCNFTRQDQCYEH